MQQSAITVELWVCHKSKISISAEILKEIICIYLKGTNVTTNHFSTTDN